MPRRPLRLTRVTAWNARTLELLHGQLFLEIEMDFRASSRRYDPNLLDELSAFELPHSQRTFTRKKLNDWLRR